LTGRGGEHPAQVHRPQVIVLVTTLSCTLIFIAAGFNYVDDTVEKNHYAGSDETAYRNWNIAGCWGTTNEAAGLGDGRVNTVALSLE